jgi:hypothetical protein
MALSPSCADCLEILGASTSWNPKGLPRPVVGKLYLPTLFYGQKFGRYQNTIVRLHAQGEILKDTHGEDNER